VENPLPAKFCAECGTALHVPDTRPQARDAARAARSAERRQLTVMFCDLVGSTALSEQLDPEEWRTVVREYQRISAEVIRHFEGYIAQYLGDGLLVYFGYPAAHEDDAQRAARAGLEIVRAVHELPSPRTQLPHPLQVRIGIHTGLVVVGEVGDGGKREQLALGETPNVAARLQGLAEPDTVVISAATYQLIAGLLDCRDLGLHTVKGISAPVQLYRVVGESGLHSRLEVAAAKGLTPLVGRSHEMGLLLERWERAKDGEGQVVLLSGEPGIGKSRLVQELKERAEHDGATLIEFRCSPYYQNTAFSPVIEHLQHVLPFHRDDTPLVRLEKLQHTLAAYRFPQADTVPLFAALLSLPYPAGFPPLNLSPQRQKQKIQEALVAWLLEEAELRAMYSVWEDLHWADPSTLELLQLLIEQIPTARLLLLLTFRPEFTPPWGTRSHISQFTLSRLGRKQVGLMAEKVTGGKVLPAEVLQQIVSKTDGVPLFVEELTKMVVESELLREADGHYELTGPLPPLAIPTTLQDSLMARLDRLATAREVAQLAATLGREFSYELIRAVSPLDEARLRQALAELVEAEMLYQRGLPPQARYLFKHALIQDAAYQSLLKSTRQQYHQQIASVLEEGFPETTETQPELLAHHYSEAGLVARAIPYWQQAGQRAAERWANVEALSHLTKGLELLKALPDTPERTRQELTLQVALGMSLIITKGQAAPEVERTYTRALELCRQIGETPQLFPVLAGLRRFYVGRGDLRTGRELGERLLRLAQRTHDSALLAEAHYSLGNVLYFQGELVAAQAHMEQGIACYDPEQSRSQIVSFGMDLGMLCRNFAALTLWMLGYPDRALKQSREALTLARQLSHPHSLVFTLGFAAWLHLLRREGQATRERAETCIALSTEQQFPHWSAWGTILQGWTLAEQDRGEEGIALIRQGLAASRAIGVELGGSRYVALLAEAYGKAGQPEEGLKVLSEALEIARRTGERYSEAELYRLKGELSLQSRQVKTSQGKSGVPNTQHPTPSTQAEAEAEACFQQAIEVARQQQAKALELRAVMSLSRLWQSRGKKAEARQMLADIYGWFTEGFETKDLQEAKALLAELA
jgi:class 3 adenylate cyclase/predicted ATPase